MSSSSSVETLRLGFVNAISELLFRAVEEDASAFDADRIDRHLRYLASTGSFARERERLSYFLFRSLSRMVERRCGCDSNASMETFRRYVDRLRPLLKRYADAKPDDPDDWPITGLEKTAYRWTSIGHEMFPAMVGHLCDVGVLTRDDVIRWWEEYGEGRTLSSFETLVSRLRRPRNCRNEPFGNR